MTDIMFLRGCKNKMHTKGTTTVQFLGTGASDWYSGWEEKHTCNETCKGRCARSKKMGGKNVRRFSCLYIAPDTIIDFTGHAEKSLRDYAVDIKPIRNILITHGHNDHFQPLEIMDFASHLPHLLTVYGNNMVKDAMEFASLNEWDRATGNFIKTYKETNIQVKTVVPGKPFFAGDIKITPVLANHMIDKGYSILEQQALNYILEIQGKTVFYGLDSSFLLPRTFEVLTRHEFDMAVFDATFGYADADIAIPGGHQNFSMLKRTIAQFRKARLFRENAAIIASHMSRAYVEPHDEIACRLKEEGIILAYDGMSVIL